MAAFDIICWEVDRLLHELPGADYIEIMAVEFLDESEMS